MIRIESPSFNAAKLMVDARKWIVSRLLAKKYGDRASEVNVTSTVNNHFVITEEEQRELQEITRRLWVEQHGNDSDKKRLLGGEDWSSARDAAGTP